MNSLRLLFNKLRDANLNIQVDKCEFLKNDTEFLDHVVTQKGIKPNPKKAECVLHYPLPKPQRKIKQFLGLSG